MGRKKKVDPLAEHKHCHHCLQDFAVPIGWCDHCKDHCGKSEIDAKTGWCTRCTAGENEDYLRRRAARKDFVPAVVEPGKTDVQIAFEKWTASDEYAHRFDTLGVTPQPGGSDKEREAIDNDAWINKHFAGL